MSETMAFENCSNVQNQAQRVERVVPGGTTMAAVLTLGFTLASQLAIDPSVLAQATPGPERAMRESIARTVAPTELFDRVEYDSAVFAARLIQAMRGKKVQISSFYPSIQESVDRESEWESQCDDHSQENPGALFEAILDLQR